MVDSNTLTAQDCGDVNLVPHNSNWDYLLPRRGDGLQLRLLHCIEIHEHVSVYIFFYNINGSVSI